MTIDKAFENFILSKKLQGCSDKTLECYRLANEPFIKFLGADFETETLTRQHYNDYILELSEKKLSRATLASYIRQIKVFLKWIEEEFEFSLKTEKLRIPKAYKKVVHIYTDEELRTIFQAVETESEWLTARNKAMISLMLDSGLRQNEVCTLQANDISWERGTVKVLGKGNKERIVPIGNLSKHYMRQYSQLCPYESNNFFIGRRGKNVTCDSVKHMMNKLSKKLPFEFSSHKLRHNFATNYCLDQYERFGQVDLYKLMILMGHEDVETTRIYLHHANQIIASMSTISHLDKVMNY